VRAPTPQAGAPRTRPGVVPAALVLALVLVGVAVTGVHDLLVERGAVAGPSWTDRLVDHLATVRASSAVTVVAGSVLVAVGLWLVLLAVRRGRRTHLLVAAGAETWISPRALGALAAEAADRAPGVLHTAVVRSSRRRVVLEVGARAGASIDRDAVLAGAREAALRESAGVPGAKVVVRLNEVAS
jgi:hypothetical protein